MGQNNYRHILSFLFLFFFGIKTAVGDLANEHGQPFIGLDFLRSVRAHFPHNGW